MEDKIIKRTKCEVWSRPRDEKGRFVRFSGMQKYKQCQKKGVRKQKHILIWEEYYGKKVPRGHIIHHIDENKKNNSINNLKLITITEHNQLHHRGRTQWNKGKNGEYILEKLRGRVVSEKQKTKCRASWFNKYLNSNISIWKLKDEGLTPSQISKKLNLTIDQVNHRWKGFTKIINKDSGRLI